MSLLLAMLLHGAIAVDREALLKLARASVLEPQFTTRVEAQFWAGSSERADCLRLACLEAVNGGLELAFDEYTLGKGARTVANVAEGLNQTRMIRSGCFDFEFEQVGPLPWGWFAEDPE